MGIKLLHTADWHLDSPFASFSPEQRRYLQAAQKRLPEEIGAVCAQERCELALLSGDIFDGEYQLFTARHLAQVLEGWGIPVFISPGNHDFWSEDAPWCRVSFPENVHIFSGELSYVDLPDLGLRVYGGGYRSMDCPGLLEGFHVPEGIRAVMTLHADPTRADSPYCPVSSRQIRDSGLRYLALGHIHRGDRLLLGDTLCAWPGCPMGRGWDEAGEKGVLLAELTEGVSLRFLPLHMPKFTDITLTLTPDKNAEEALAACLPPAASEDFFRVKLTGVGAPALPALYRTFSRFPNLFLQDETRAPTALWEQAGEDSLEGRFFALLQETATEQPELAALAASIAGKLLEGEEVELP